MNRALKRALKHKRVQQERVVPLPRAIDEFVVFDMPQRMLDEIKSDRLSVDAEGTPVFQDNHGVWQEITPSLAGWIVTWERILTTLTPASPHCSLEGLKEINRNLNDDIDIEPETLALAIAEFEYCRHVFRNSDRSKIQSIAKTSQIAMLIKD